MADRPWTAVAKDKVQNEHVTFVFNGGFDTNDAAKDFKEQHGYKYNLVALIPGDHRHVYIEGKKKIKRIPERQLFSGF